MRPTPAITPNMSARRRDWSVVTTGWEESMVVIGTPHNLISEGLADLGFEVIMGPRPEKPSSPIT